MTFSGGASVPPDPPISRPPASKKSASGLPRKVGFLEVISRKPTRKVGFLEVISRKPTRKVGFLEIISRKPTRKVGFLELPIPKSEHFKKMSSLLDLCLIFKCPYEHFPCVKSVHTAIYDQKSMFYMICWGGSGFCRILFPIDSLCLAFGERCLGTALESTS